MLVYNGSTKQCLSIAIVVGMVIYLSATLHLYMMLTCHMQEERVLTVALRQFLVGKANTRSSDRITESENPLVCIVMPTYNVEEYVERSLQSILHQTYPNFQVIVVDDSSTDSTRTNINKYVQSDHRFSLVHLTQNTAGGSGQPTNIGFDSCPEEADYFLLADGDDWMERDALESLMLDARRFHSDFVLADFDIFFQQNYSSGCNRIELDGRRLDPFNRTSVEYFCNETASARWPFKFEPSYDRQKFDSLPTAQVFNFYTHPAVLQISPVTWRKLYRKSFLETFKLRFLEGDVFFEDNAFHWMTSFHATRITKVGRVLFHHMRNREGQVTLAMTSNQELVGSKTSHFKVDDIVFAKLKYKDNWSWYPARLNAIHLDYDGDQTTYDVTAQFKGITSQGLNSSYLLSAEDSQYWKTYSGVTRLSNIIANFHSIGHEIFSKILLENMGENDQLAVTIFAQTYFKKLYSTRFIADTRFPELYRKFMRKLRHLERRWKSSLENVGCKGLKSSKWYTGTPINLVNEIDLSIVVPTKDVSVYLPDFLRDVYYDLTSSDITFEVFAVDDGSSDGTVQILRKFAAEHSSNFYFLEANGNGPGRARNNAITLMEGKYVYFADADDSFDFKALGSATRTAKETGSDLLIFPYKIEYVHLNHSMTKGMFLEDARIWNEILKEHDSPNINLKLAALRLINYPWKQLTASSLIHDNDIFFGPTEVQNDLQFHWTSIAAAQNIKFYNQPVCTHRKFDLDVKKQLTNIAGPVRMSILDALGMTQRALALQGAFNFEEGGQVFNAYVKFFGHITKWAEKLVSEEYLPYFFGRKSNFFKALEEQEPAALAKWAYWEADVGLLPALMLKEGGKSSRSDVALKLENAPNKEDTSISIATPAQHTYCYQNSQYRCQGDAYDNFTSQLAQYVLEQNRTCWGKRRFPLPSGANVLVLGNSHMRQIMLTLICQHSQVISSSTSFLVANFSAGTYNIKFSNGARLVIVTNSPLLYSKDWPHLLQKYDPLHQSLEVYTAVVLGQFNPSTNISANRFTEQMLAFERQYPNEIHFSTMAPPTLHEVSLLYPRTPILAVSMFAKYGLRWESEVQNTISVLSQTRDRPHPQLTLLRGRAHIEALGIECGSDGVETVNDCCNQGDATPFKRMPEDMHRCTGVKGGHADLLAWDVIDALHEMISSVPRLTPFALDATDWDRHNKNYTSYRRRSRDALLRINIEC